MPVTTQPEDVAALAESAGIALDPARYAVIAAALDAFAPLLDSLGAVEVEEESPPDRLRRAVVSDAVLQLDATGAGELIRRREVSPVELAEAALERIARVEPAVSAFACVLPEQALAAARNAEHELASGLDRGLLHGIPVAAKDLFDTAGVPTEGGCRAYSGRVPASDAACVARLREAGAVLVGKTHTHELAYGVTTPGTHNPWSLGHVVGGSSGGSAAAVAAGECAIALGTDTAGSIRIPAACCGVAGLKPRTGESAGTASCALAPSLDTAGPLGRSVRDLALALAVLAGHDRRDPASVDVPLDDYLGSLDGGVAGLTLGMAGGHFSSSLDPDVQAAVREAVEMLAGAGAAIRRRRATARRARRGDGVRDLPPRGGGRARRRAAGMPRRARRRGPHVPRGRRAAAARRTHPRAARPSGDPPGLEDGVRGARRRDLPDAAHDGGARRPGGRLAARSRHVRRRGVPEALRPC